MFRLRKKKKQIISKYMDIVPPDPIPNRTELAIVCIVKNEARYLEEWLNFHILAGVDKFIIYDNNSTDHTKEILSKPAYKKLVNVNLWNYPIKDKDRKFIFNEQIMAYCHAICNYGNKFKYFSFIDVDEFMVPKEFNSIKEELKEIGNYSNISLPWHMYGHCGHETRPSGGVLRNYNLRAATPYQNDSKIFKFKCIVDPCKVNLVGIHRFETVDMKNRTVNTLGKISTNELRKSNNFFTSDRIQLNHYYGKSKQEFERKIDRVWFINKHRPDSRPNMLRQRLNEIEQETVLDMAAVNFLNRVGVAASSDISLSLPHPPRLHPTHQTAV